MSVNQPNGYRLAGAVSAPASADESSRMPPLCGATKLCARRPPCSLNCVPHPMISTRCSYASPTVR
jgi:hypothetical protein